MVETGGGGGMANLGSAMRRQGGMLPGLPLLVPILLLGLLVEQATSVAAPAAFGAMRAAALSGLCLPMLFALAGTMLAAGAERQPAGEFLLHRLIACWPPLILSVLLAMLVIGPLVTWLPLTTYLRDGDLHRFALNMLAVPVRDLPGVFQTNTTPLLVNAAYLALPVLVAGTMLAALGGRFRWTGAIIAILLLAILAAPAGVRAMSALTGPDGRIIGIVLDGSRLTAAIALLLGLLAWRWRRFVPIADPDIHAGSGRATIATALALALVLALVLARPKWADDTLLRVAIALPATYLALCLAAMRPPLPLHASPVIARLHDARHLFFLTAYPIQQTSVAMAGKEQGWIANVAIALPLTLATALLGTSAIGLLLGRLSERMPVIARLRAPATAPLAIPPAARRTTARAGRRTLARIARMTLLATLFLLAMLGVVSMLMLALQRDIVGL